MVGLEPAGASGRLVESLVPVALEVDGHPDWLGGKPELFDDWGFQGILNHSGRLRALQTSVQIWSLINSDSFVFTSTP